jgi:hypothetical protein
MSMTLSKSDFPTIAIFCLFIFYVVWWTLMHIFVPSGDTLYDIFTDSYGIIAGVGGFLSYLVARKWGARKSLLGRSLVFLSIALFFQFLGQISYAIYHYIFFVDNPYPSFGEIFYFGSIPIYILGVSLIGRVSGAGISIKSLYNKIVVVVIPVIMVAFSYFLFLGDYSFGRSDPLVIFLDWGYPVGQAFFVSVALANYVLCKKVLGGIMRGKVLFLLGALISQYIADTVFLYRTYTDTWYAGGISDLLFVFSYTFMSFAILSFDADRALEKLAEGKRQKSSSAL